MSGTDIVLPDTSIPTLAGPPDSDDWYLIERQAEMLAGSTLLPAALKKKKSPEQVKADLILITLQARELRIPLTQAISKIHVIEGTPSTSAEMMVALILRSGHLLRPVEQSDHTATAMYRRKEWPDDQHGEFSYTMLDAEVAGLRDLWFERWHNEQDRSWKETWTVPMDVVRDCERPDDINAARLKDIVAEYGAPEWVEQQGHRKMKFKDNWWKFPKSMLWARCVSQIGRSQFADVLMGVSLTPEELGAEVDPITGDVLTAPADDAVKEALLERAKALPERNRETVKTWFRENTVPPIARLPKKWVEAVDERLAEEEQWIVEGEEATPSEGSGEEGDQASEPIEVTAREADASEETRTEHEQEEWGDDGKPPTSDVVSDKLNDVAPDEPAGDAPRRWSMAELRSLSADELKDICDTFDPPLKKGGRKEELIGRILGWQADPTDTEPETSTVLDPVEVAKMPHEALVEACTKLGMELTGDESHEELAEAFAASADKPFD